MLNFRKGASSPVRRAMKMPTRNMSRRTRGGVLAVWGSPGSGKTTVAARIAKAPCRQAQNTILLLCDMSAPMLPASAHPGISKTKDLWGASWLPPMCLTV